MFNAQLRFADSFTEITAQVDQLAKRSAQAAAETAAVVANENAFIPLELELIEAHGDVDGYSAGIKSRKTSRHGPTLIAGFFDGGTLAGRTRKLKQPRRGSWQVNRGGSTYTAHRQPIAPATGIEAQNFFPKARAAGRKRMAEIVRRGF